MTIFGETFVSGGITPRTAQLAPAVAAAQPRPATGGGVAPVAEPVPAAQPAPAGQAAPAPVASGGTPASLPAPLAGAIALVAIGVTVSLLVGRRRRAQAA